MRIDPKHLSVTPVVTKNARDVAVPASERRDPAAVVKLSSAGAAAVDSSESQHAEKVARLREMIETGRYEVDLDMLASRIVEDDPLGGSTW